VPLVFFVAGLSWFLASAGVYLPDLRQMVPVLVVLLLFLSPIFYPLSAIPEWFRFYIHLNPLAHIIEEARGVLFHARPPSWIRLGYASLAAWAVAWLGLVWFQKTRKGFADVI
jgi:lipopolysaccharide transport system permease protein